MKMTHCESCGYTDIRLPSTDCPLCEYGQMQRPRPDSDADADANADQ